jgi:transcriptional regulator with PAS, ATPase and Fis domain
MTVNDAKYLETCFKPSQATIRAEMEIKLIGVSQNIERIRKLIDQVADTNLNILVCGETGVGKEVVVRSLYQKSTRLGKPFVKVNCAALPHTLLESEMFGYEKGAFTGAHKKMRGKFEQADGGVLFLDEIGDMPLPLQSKMLHALQDGDFSPLGSDKLISTDVWVIAATNHDLEDDIAKGTLRADLYQRLNEIKITVQPLRNRPEDIPYLIDHFTKKFQAQLNKKPLRSLSKRTTAKLIQYHWPGNVRELQNEIKRIIVLGENSDRIDEMLTDNTGRSHNTDIETLVNKNSIPIELSSLNPEKALGDGSLSLKRIIKETRNQVDRELISYVLKKTHGNRGRAAKILNVSSKTLYNKIDELNIKPFI